MTRLVASIFVDDLVSLDEAAQRAWKGCADAVELRIDTFDGDPTSIAEFVRRHPDRMWILTCRGAEEGGYFRGDTQERVARLIAASRDTGAYVDFELADFRRSDNIRQKILLAATPPGGGAPRLILSAHRFDGPMDDLATIAREARSLCGEAIVKVAYKSTSVADSFAALDFLQESPRRSIAIAMGDSGLWTRVLAKKLGAFATYAALDAGDETAPGQSSLDEMNNLFRWGAIDRDTKVFGVVGDPVSHSLSPRLFNAWFDSAGVDAVYVPLRVGGGTDELAAFARACVERPWLSVGELSVTIPHKRAALRYLGDSADHLARYAGAVNTIVFQDQQAVGYNTDCYAAMASLRSALEKIGRTIAGSHADVLGVGGAARAIVLGLREHGCTVTVYGRDAEKTGAFAEEFNCAAADWDDRNNRVGDILVNTTPIGMWPRVGESPMPATSLGGCKLVFDLIYRPQETQLLFEARAAGCAVLNGLEMFVRQAAMQYELWFKERPDVDAGMRVLERVLASESGK